MLKQHSQAPPGFVVIFRRWKINPTTGEREYLVKAKAFRMVIPKNRRRN